MTRPCFLVVDREYASSLSTRKLVIETAKFNVITAYSGAEALATIKKFREVNGIVLDAGVHDIPLEQLISEIKAVVPGAPVVVVGRLEEGSANGADYHLYSFDPNEVLALLRKLEPADAAAIDKQNERLSKELSAG